MIELPDRLDNIAAMHEIPTADPQRELTILILSLRQIAREIREGKELTCLELTRTSKP